MPDQSLKSFGNRGNVVIIDGWNYDAGIGDLGGIATIAPYDPDYR
jgi:hypothetical protein